MMEVDRFYPSGQNLSFSLLFRMKRPLEDSQIEERDTNVWIGILEYAVSNNWVTLVNKSTLFSFVMLVDYL